MDPQDQTRTIPANLEAERVLLGSILIDPAALTNVLPLVEAGDFFREAHSWIYAAMRSLHQQGKPIDFITIIDHLELTGQLNDAGGPAYITDLITGTPTSINAGWYANLIRRDAAAREIIRVAGDLAEYAYDIPEDATADTIVAKALAISNRLLQRAPAGMGRKLSTVLMDEIKRINYIQQNNIRAGGLPTGFVMLDKLTGGLEKGELTIIAARPSMGKSSFAVGIAVNAAKLVNARTLIFTLEMSDEQLGRRILSMESAIDSQRLRLAQVTDEEWTPLLAVANETAAYDITLIDKPAQTIHEIRAYCEADAYQNGPINLVVVDYIGLMGVDDDSENRALAIGAITRDLKILAGKLHCPVIALSQLNRKLEQRADKRPMMSDLRDSGETEQNADNVFFIYRDDYYNEESEQQGLAEIIVAKARNGSPGTVTLFFRKELTLFKNLEIERVELRY